MHFDYVRGFLNQIKVYDLPGMIKSRLGRPGDGGYVVLANVCPLAGRLYSYGVGDDVSFELDFAGRFPQVKDILLFDPNIEGFPSFHHDKFRFCRTGLSPHDLPTKAPEDSFLKIDVEWEEWDSLLAMPTSLLEKFSQVIVEFHILHVEPRNDCSPYFRAVYKKAADEMIGEMFSMYEATMARMNHLFWCFHAHANNSLPLVEVNGHRFPPLLEMSFVRKGLVGGHRPFSGVLPIPGLDMPNKTDRADVLDWYPLIKEESCLMTGQSRSAGTP